MLAPLHALEAAAEATAAAAPQLWRRADWEVVLLVWRRGDHAPPTHQRNRVNSKGDSYNQRNRVNSTSTDFRCTAES